MLLLKASQVCIAERKSCLLMLWQARGCHPTIPCRMPFDALVIQRQLVSSHQYVCLIRASYLLQAKQPQGITFWINIAIIVVFSVGGLLAAVGSIRQIAMHAQTYDLFH